MRNKLRLFFILFYCSATHLHAQDTITTIANKTANYIILEYGIHHLADQDLIFSPFILKDYSAKNLALTYKRYKKTAQLARISYDQFDPVFPDAYTFYSKPDSAKTETIKDDFTIVKAKYGIGKIIRSNEKYAWILGGMSDNTVMAKYYYAGIFSTFGYFASFGLSAWSQVGYKLNENNTVAAYINLPLAAWVCRSPYLANDDTFIENTESHNGLKTFFAYVNDGNLQTLNKLQELDFELSYTHTINLKFAFGAGWQFSYTHNSIPLNLVSVQNRFNLKFTYKL